MKPLSTATKKAMEPDLDLLRRVLEIEAEEILMAKRELDHEAVYSLNVLDSSPGRVITSGVGKSGLVAQKVSASLNGIARPSQFLHPTEAFHGDLGMVSPGDTLLFFSRSGHTFELLKLARHLKLGNYPLVAVVGRSGSPLDGLATSSIRFQICREAYGLADIPSSSTTVMIALGDAIVSVLALRSGFGEKEYNNLHPAGNERKKDED